MKKRAYYFRGGITLVESIVTIAIFSMIIVTLVASILYFYRSNTYSIEQSFAVSSARKGIEIMVRDIREATYSEEGAYPIISATTTEFFFYSDVDRDNSVERIRFSATGTNSTNFVKGVTNASGTPFTYSDADEQFSVISDNVRNSDQGVDIFEYYNASGTQLTSTSKVTDIAFVIVNLIVNINPNRLPNEFTLRSSATIRNLKTNL